VGNFPKKNVDKIDYRWRNPSNFEDSFWRLFFNLFIALLSLLSQFIYTFLPGRDSIIFCVCYGKVIPSNENLPLKKNHSLTAVVLLSFIFHCFVKFKLFMFKRKSNNDVIETNNTRIKQIEVSSFIGFTSNAIILGSILKRNFYEIFAVKTTKIDRYLN